MIKIKFQQWFRSNFYIAMLLLVGCSEKTVGENEGDEKVSKEKIVFMGSSVCQGMGAEGSHGYASMYKDLLISRAYNSLGYNWNVSNISIPGDNTIKVLNRWEHDLLPEKGNYVVYGLSLGNEGVKDRKQVAYDDFNENMSLLVSKAREEEYVPVIMNNYTRFDFEEEEYNYIKEMNLHIHQMDVPSVNLLGTIDNGTGKWAEGYYADGWHPNRAGHFEFYLAMVPSLFDALKDGKRLPERMTGNGSLMSSSLLLMPEEKVHSYTTIFSFKTKGTGTICELMTNGGLATISLDGQNNTLVYKNNRGKQIVCRMNNPETEWFRVALTHYYAWGKTMLYINGVGQGHVDERTELYSVKINTLSKPTTVADWFFYRSGMNANEMEAIESGAMLKSSLEVYVPMHDKDYSNIAQSKNEIDIIE